MVEETQTYREERPPAHALEDPSKGQHSKAAAVDGGGGGSITTSASLLDSRGLEDVRRLHRVLLILYGVFVGIVLVSEDGSRFAMLTIAAVAFAAVASVIVLVYVRDQSRVRFAVFMPLSFPSTIGGFFATYYLGFFSPVFAVHVIAVYTVGTSSKMGPRAEWIAYVQLAVMYAIGTFGIALGLLSDRGRIRPDADSRELLVCAVVVQVFLLMAFLLSRRNTKSLKESVEKFASALREVSRRDALLDEANQDLKRLLHLDGGGEGRATGMLVGSWKLGSILGRGGMGEVYEAVHVALSTRAAVKLIPPDALRDAEAAARFRREARVLEKLDNPHIVKVYEVSDSFIAMERLVGSDLAGILRDKTQLPIEQVITMIAQVARALEAAREADVVHRDVKPQNIFFVEQTQSYKVLDFGVSKIGHGGTLTQGMVVGTPAYMAPEQLSGVSVDHRADVFSLAVVAFRALTGRPAFSGPDNAKIFYEVLHAQPPQPSSLADEIPPDVDLALALGLAKSASDRIDRATDFAKALADASQGALGDVLRRRGAALVAKHGWSETRD